MMLSPPIDYHEYITYYEKICFIGLSFKESSPVLNKKKLNNCINTINDMYKDEFNKIVTQSNENIKKLECEKKKEVDDITAKFKKIFLKNTSRINHINYSYELSAVETKYKLIKHIEKITSHRSLKCLQYTFQNKYCEIIYTYNLDTM